MTSTDPKLPEGTRPTRQRRAVAAVLQSFDDFRSAQDIHDLLRRAGDTVGLSTVYRTLQALADGGEVDVLRTEDGEALYRRCSERHHHHLVCRSCGRTVGLLLVSALMVIPVATAQQVTRGFRSTLFASMAIGAVAALAGVLVSAFYHF